MNTEQQTTPIKNKGGRPRKDKKGAMVWISAEFMDSVNAYLELLKQQRQAKP
jgi:hypothetical protein